MVKYIPIGKPSLIDVQNDDTFFYLLEFKRGEYRFIAIYVVIDNEVIDLDIDIDLNPSVNMTDAVASADKYVYLVERQHRSEQYI